MHVALTILALTGCERALIAFGANPTQDDSGAAPDADGDGVTVVADCDDANAAVGARTVEAWNGRDDDCDGLVDMQKISRMIILLFGPERLKPSRPVGQRNNWSLLHGQPVVPRNL